MIVAVIQARIGSRRLPGKMLLPLGGESVLAFMVRRVQRSPSIDRMVVATTRGKADDALASEARRLGVAVYRGARDDVLDRVYRAAKQCRPADADMVVRLTGDCPFAEPEVIEAVIAEMGRHTGCRYVRNASPPTFPDGLDVEAIRFDALREAWQEATEPHQREHVTPYLVEHPRRFGMRNVRCWLGDLSDERWTLDEPSDHVFLSTVAERLPADFTWRDVLALLGREPALRQLNAGTRRNEGSIETMKASIESRAPRLPIAESEAWWHRREGLIPAGTMTLSKGPTQFVDGVAPKYLARGLGSHVWDVDGNEYIDYPLGLGAVTLGHRHPEVNRAISRQLEESGISFTLMHPLEVKLAERLREVVPCAEMVRFGKNGSDATSAAVRAARAYTGRPMIARCGYHGWQDWSVDSSYGIRSRGVPEEVKALTVAFGYNDPASLEARFAEHPNRIAAVILEPVVTVLPKDGFLERVRDIAHAHGAVLIFDEIVTGFRLARGGAMEYFGVTPDLAALGKGLGNGMPISVVAGRSEVMKAFEEVFFSFTFGGETLSIAAALTVIDVMEREDYWAHISRLGMRLQQGYRELVAEFGLEEVTDCVGLPQWTVITFAQTGHLDPLVAKSLFQQEVLKRGILFNGVQFLSLAHTEEEIERTLEVYREAMKVLRFAVDTDSAAALLEGRPIEPVFRIV
jgi:glutamate-1-semialdehyde aminotransferase/spore coat polysaccharide biosynthesis protein SpsF (cytidylyltransferase family)